MAISAILVSVSLGTSSSSSTDTDAGPEAGGVASSSSSSSSSAASHEHVLETFCSADDFADSSGNPVEAAAAKLLRSILDCVRLLERHLADEYPTVASAASHAADRVARYAGIADEPRPRGSATGNDVRVGGGSGGEGAAVNAAVASDGAGGAAAGLAGRKKLAVGSSKIAAAGQAKSRRCSTPTGVEGIVHIEMAAIRNSSVDNGGGGLAGGGARESVGAVHEPAKLSSLDKSAAAGVGVGGGEGKSTQQKHPRPAPCATRPCGGGSFPFSSEDVAFARAAKRRKKLVGATAARAAAAAAGAVATTVVVAPTAAMPAAATSEAAAAVATTTTTKKTVVVQTASGLGLTLRGGAAASSSSWQPFSSASLWRSAKTGLGSGGGSGTIGGAGRVGVGVGTLAGSSLLCSRKRAAEALGHCENGSGFGAPAPRVPKVARGAPAAAAAVDTPAGGIDL